MHRVLCILMLCTMPALAADRFAGTFKLNTDKSTGPAKSTEAKLVATDQDGTETIVVTGKIQDGPDYRTAFSVPLHGGPGKMTEPGPFNSVKAKAFTAKTSDFLFMTDGKPAMHVHSVLSEDGKVMTTTRKVMSGPAKPGTYTDVWERE